MINISDPEGRMSLESEFPEPDDLFLLAESELFSTGYTTIAQAVTVDPTKLRDRKLTRGSSSK